MTLAELKSDILGPRCTGITEDDLNAMAREAFAKIPKTVRAMRNKAVVWIAPYRKDGVIEVPWDCTGNSVEAVIWDDNTGMQLECGRRVMVRPDHGILHTVNGVELCFIEAQGLMLAVQN